MTTKVNFELLKDTIGLLHNGSLPTEEHFNNLLLFFDKLAESSTFAHLAHKQLSKPQRPFDKLKKIWDEWNSWLEVTPMEQWKSFEEWYGNGDNLKETHRSLAEYCGFITTAEVRRAIQELKNK